VVPESLGRTAVERLQSMDYAVDYRSYPMAHAVCPQQIGDISRWLSARLAR